MKIKRPFRGWWFPPRGCAALSLFQLRVLLYQLLQTEARELYRNLSVFPISFALIHSSFAIFGMFDLLPGAESPLSYGLVSHQFRNAKFLAAGRKKIGNVVDGIV